MNINRKAVKNLILTTVVCAELLSCSTMQLGTRRGGQTLYLEAFDPSVVPNAAMYNQDLDSYWDGDNYQGSPSIVIDLSDQKAYFYKSGQLVGVSAISSGDVGHSTPCGQFKIIQKDQWHKSNLYGDYIDSAGNILKTNIDVNKDPKPPGAIFDGSKMHHFMRFNGGIGMHEGFLPGYPASHGCVRMPAFMAQKYFNHVTVGVPVTVRP
jgi:lipoprotein-anchoring transpeptidase ErfK/SrfK